jgi:hypothetical protein
MSGLLRRDAAEVARLEAESAVDEPAVATLRAALLAARKSPPCLIT